jgi:AraC-like DNA-binding protein
MPAFSAVSSVTAHAGVRISHLLGGPGVRLRSEVGRYPGYGLLLPCLAPVSDGGADQAPGFLFNFLAGVSIDVAVLADMLFVVMPHDAFDQVPGRWQLNASPIDEGAQVVDDDPTMRHLCLALLSRPETDRPRSMVFERSLTSAMLAYFIRRHCPTMPSRSSGQGIMLEPWQLRIAEAAMLDCLDQPLRIPVIAKRCGVSAVHFSRAFRSTTSETPCRWLMRRRIERACKMMQDSDETLADVALACGFADQSHLTRTFATILGVTPAAWRSAQRVARQP